MSRLGPKQAARLFQLSAGYVVASTKDHYEALRAKGFVKDSARYLVGDVEYERSDGRALPTVTWEGQQALRNYVERNGRLEIEIKSPMAHYTTVLRMDPQEAA